MSTWSKEELAKIARSHDRAEDPFGIDMHHPSLNRGALSTQAPVVVGKLRPSSISIDKSASQP